MSYGDQYEEGEYDGDAQNGSEFHDDKYGREGSGSSDTSNEQDMDGDNQEEGGGEEEEDADSGANAEMKYEGY